MFESKEKFIDYHYQNIISMKLDIIIEWNVVVKQAH
jgi:hypothetical protein